MQRGSTINIVACNSGGDGHSTPSSGPSVLAEATGGHLPVVRSSLAHAGTVSLSSFPRPREVQGSPQRQGFWSSHARSCTSLPEVGDPFYFASPSQAGTSVSGGATGRRLRVADLERFDWDAPACATPGTASSSASAFPSGGGGSFGAGGTSPQPRLSPIVSSSSRLSFGADVPLPDIDAVTRGSSGLLPPSPTSASLASASLRPPPPAPVPVTLPILSRTRSAESGHVTPQPTEPEDLKETVSVGAKFEGVFQDAIGPEMWGITFEQLELVCSAPKYLAPERDIYGRHTERGLNMREVVERVVKPMTAGTGVGYALLQNRSRPLRARVMVSHAWDEDYEDFLAALKASRIRGPYWVCAMALYQAEDIETVTIEKQLGPSPSSGPFAAVLRDVEVMVAITTRQCNIYSRMWCVYEMFCALQLGVKVVTAQAIQYSDDCGFQDTFTEQCKVPICSRLARCGKPSSVVNEDERRIRAEIEAIPGGYDLVDVAVEVQRLHALMTRRWDTAVSDAQRRRSKEVGLPPRSQGRWSSSATKHHGQDLGKMYVRHIVRQLRRIASKGTLASPHTGAVAQLLGEEDAEVREAAAEALGSFGEAASGFCGALATAAVEDEEDEVRRAAAEALGKMDCEEATNHIRNFAETVAGSPVDHQRHRASRALAFVGRAAEDHLDLISEALKDTNPTVRLNVTGLLASLAAQRAFSEVSPPSTTAGEGATTGFTTRASTAGISIGPPRSAGSALSLGGALRRGDTRGDTPSPDDRVSRQWQERKELIKELIKANFKEADLDQNGSLDQRELSLLLRRGRSDLSEGELRLLFAAVDRDGDGRVVLDEFVDFLFSSWDAPGVGTTRSGDPSPRFAIEASTPMGSR